MGTRSSSPELAIGTIATCSHLAFARVLGAALAEHHPELTLQLLLIDEPHDGIPAADEPFTTIPLTALGPSELPSIRFRLSAHQLASLGKPWLLRHLLDQGHPSALYLDADMLVTGDLAPLLDRVRRHALVLTPHLLGPQEPERELYVLRAGAYNAGVIGVSDRPELRRFLEWWQQRIRTLPGVDLERGLHNDQGWLDLAPGFVEDLHVLRHPGVNVGHWALPARLDDDPAPRLVHFSGFDPLVPERLSRHDAQLQVDALEALQADYARRLLSAGHDRLRYEPYGFASYDDGTPIPDAARRAHLALGTAADGHGDPFRSGPSSFRAWFEAQA
jgi:hypothetical protein